MPGPPVGPLSLFAFGKLPAHGDFVARGLRPAERQAWDEWASGAVACARDALGERFDAAHAAALPWRFAFGGGLFGGGWRAGAIAPSIDHRGRRFVFVLGAAAHKGLAPDADGATIAAELEAQIYRAFQAGLNVDELLAQSEPAVAAAHPAAPDGAEPDRTDPAPGRFWLADADGADVRAAAPPSDLLLRMLTERGAVS